jgi:hypothetical protein
MASRAGPPDTHVIQRSPERVACTSCDRPIEEGEPHFSEAIVGDDGQWARSLRYARTPRQRERDDPDDRGSPPKLRGQISPRAITTSSARRPTCQIDYTHR